MTIQQTVDIPASRTVRFEVVLPQNTPCGKTPVVLNFPFVPILNEASKAEPLPLIAERLAAAESLFGILPPDITHDEIQIERLKRYESNR